MLVRGVSARAWACDNAAIAVECSVGRAVWGVQCGACSVGRAVWGVQPPTEERARARFCHAQV
eukprot:355965-Chlamydomonas_euryale.AAC.4